MPKCTIFSNVVRPRFKSCKKYFTPTELYSGIFSSIKILASEELSEILFTMVLRDFNISESTSLYEFIDIPIRQLEFDTNVVAKVKAVSETLATEESLIYQESIKFSLKEVKTMRYRCFTLLNNWWKTVTIFYTQCSIRKVFT